MQLISLKDPVTVPAGSKKQINSTGREQQIIKSPSDTTVYAPALKRAMTTNFIVNEDRQGFNGDKEMNTRSNPNMGDKQKAKMGNNSQRVETLILGDANTANVDQSSVREKQNSLIINKISEFVDQIHLEQGESDTPVTPPRL